MVDRAIKQFKDGLEAPSILLDAAFHLVLSGGKRVRPFILIKSSELFGVKIEYSLPAAVSIELLHNFTLIHDDIMDRDEYRRGVKTTHVLYGDSVAIIAGDYLFSQVFHILSSNYDDVVAGKLVNLFSQASNQICMGQTMDVLPDKYIFSKDSYLDMVYLKTGALIEASAVAGGIIGGASSRELDALKRYGGRIGIAFQISDDILGIIGDPKVTGKPVGNDIRNGKKTLLVLEALERMDDDEREFFNSVFGSSTSSDEDVRKAIDIIVSTGVIEESRRYMRRLYSEAVDALSLFDDSLPKRYLIDMAKFIIERRK
jgi:geranylgeranyl diphosphate synthase type I